MITLPLMLLTGCATIMHGTRQSVGISSYPSNADVWVDNNYIGKSTPVVKLARKDNHIVRIELKGYATYETTLTHQVSGWMFGNLAYGGLLGLAVDAISGGLYKLTPDQVEVEMKRGGYSSASKKGDEIYIAAVLKADPSWEKIGNLTPLK